MSTKQLPVLIAIFFCVIVSMAPLIRTFAYQEPDILLTAGQKISEFDAAMRRFGYRETIADMRSFEKNHALRMWDVHEGALVASYSLDTETVSGICYLLKDKKDKRPKGEEASFLIDARDFNPKTRELKIVLKEPPNRN